MATIKRYTDISQAKILDKILSSKGADMFFKCVGEHTYDLTFCEVSYSEWAKDYKELYDKAGIQVIPCWSLAALLGVLPKNLNIGRPSLESNYKGYYWIQYYNEFMKPNNYKTKCFDNPVDACVAMIEKLHELNLL